MVAGRRLSLAALACVVAALSLTACGGGDGDGSVETDTAPTGVGVGPSQGTLSTDDAAPEIRAYLARTNAPKAALITCTPAPARKYEVIACKVTLEDGHKILVALRVTKLEQAGPRLEVVGAMPDLPKPPSG